MPPPDADTPDQSRSEAQRRRAAKLHRQIEDLKTQSTGENESAPRRPMSPREFINQKMREHKDEENQSG